MSSAPVLRIRGLDLARFVAIAGMVVVHASSDLAADPPLGGGSWLEVTQSVLTNRARPLFFLLAGTGVALLAARGRAGPANLLRRAGLLTVLGVLLALSGWSDLVLVFYGVLFALAPLLLRLPTAWLLGLAVAVAAPAVVRLAEDPLRDDTVTHVLRIVGEAVPLFCVGLALGRSRLDARRTPARLVGLGAAAALPGLVVLAVRGALDVTEVDGGVELAAALTSTTGLCLVVVGLCLAAGDRRWAAPLVVAGSMPLTAYVGHAVLFPLLARAADLSLGAATALAVGYLVVVAVAASVWRRHRGAGPLEQLLRRVSEPASRT